MAYRCVVKVCPNSYPKTRIKDPNLRFFPFPRDKKMQEEWSRACQVNESLLFGNYTTVCSTHFLPTDYERDLRAELMKLPRKKPTLKSDAVPSRFLTAEEIRNVEVSNRKQVFQKCLIDYYEENETESNETTLCDFLISNLGIPKILISTLDEEESENIPTEASATEAIFTAVPSVLESSTCELKSYKSSKHVFNLSDLCRLCGCFSDRMKPISDNGEFNFHKLIDAHLPSVQVDGDVLPKKICYHCEDSLISWCKFSKKCSAANKRFQSIIHLLAKEKEKKLEKRTARNILDVDHADLFHLVEISEDGHEEILVSCVDDINDMPSSAISFSSSVPFKPARMKKKRVFKTRPVCEICQKSFRCAYTRKIHLRTIHSNERPFICGTCDAHFKRKDHLQCHITMVHESKGGRPMQRNAKRPGGGTHLCAECGKIFYSKNSYREHNNSVHANIMRYHCKQCDVWFNRYSKYYHHSVVLKHAKNDFYKMCSYCGLEFHSKIYYVRHTVKHEEVAKCEKCDTEYESHAAFKEHVLKTHYSKYEYACDVCSKKCTSKTSLFQHKKTHDGCDRPFKCEHCEWSFRNRGQLSVHMHRHTGERPYVCNICNRGFKQSGDMRKHKAGHLLAEKKSSLMNVEIQNVEIKIETVV